MKHTKGVCIWFTGRSGAGKSTITNALLPMLEEHGRTVTVLDVVPILAKHWCEKTSEGKLLRKGFVASEIVRHGGVAVCVTVSARRETREAVREMVGSDHFVEVYVNPPATVAAARKAKRKGKRKPLLKRVRHALRQTLARLPFRQSGSYEVPLSPELTIDSGKHSPEESAKAIFQLLVDRGFLILEMGQNGALISGQTAESRSGEGRAT